MKHKCWSKSTISASDQWASEAAPQLCAFFVEKAPCHTAMLPVAVAIQCWAD
ncbi:MAG: fumarate hydratase [Halobacteriota archaeon]